TEVYVRNYSKPAAMVVLMLGGLSTGCAMQTPSTAPLLTGAPTSTAQTTAAKQYSLKGIFGCPSVRGLGRTSFGSHLSNVSSVRRNSCRNSRRNSRKRHSHNMDP